MSTAMPDPPGGLGPEARALLDAARDGLSPDAAAVRRVHARIHVATGGAAAAGTALGVKLGLFALVTAGVFAGAVVYGRRAPTAGAPSAPPARPVDSRQAVAQTAAPPTAAPPPSDKGLIAIEPAPRAPTRRTAPRPAAPGSRLPAAAAASASAPPIALGREVELIDLAMAGLRRGDAEAALRVIHEYFGETTGKGQLAEDAAAIEVEALCRLGDPAAHTVRAQFDARFPRSAQRSRLEATCR
jgi:hypothetical protein